MLEVVSTIILLMLLASKSTSLRSLSRTSLLDIYIRSETALESLSLCLNNTPYVTCHYSGLFLLDVHPTLSVPAGLLRSMFPSLHLLNLPRRHPLNQTRPDLERLLPTPLPRPKCILRPRTCQARLSCLFLQ